MVTDGDAGTCFRSDGGETPELEVDYGSEPPSTAIVSAIAEFEGTEPTGVGFVLHDFVDVEALDRLFDARRRSGDVVTLTFRVDGYRVTVRNDGTITIDPSA